MKNIENKKKLKYQNGIALVEVIAALGIAVVAITALVSLSIATLRTSLDSKLLLEGTKIANREIELVRAYRDGSTWSEFMVGFRDASCDTECYMDTSSLTPINGSFPEGSGVEVVRRSFSVSNPDDPTNPIDFDNPPDIVRVSVSVNWDIGDEQKGSYVYTDLSNWRKQ